MPAPPKCCYCREIIDAVDGVWIGQLSGLPDCAHAPDGVHARQIVHVRLVD